MFHAHFQETDYNSFHVLARNVDFATFEEAWQTGLAVGVPGVPKMMEELWSKYGTLPWAELFQPAIDIATNGFSLYPRTALNAHELLELNEALGYSCPDNKLFFRDPTASEYFLDGCEPKPPGTPLVNPGYAKLMKLLAEKGSDGFYMGEVAQAIVDAVASDVHVPGDLTLEDLKMYEVIEREPVCCEYMGHDVCGMGPPSSGALAICQQLGILENFKDFGTSGELLNEYDVHLVTSK